ncbi:MAG: hypothetical protein GBAus27B_000138 [Mycoplasmataceae bacterium]|nr:MAG: hypothetical protein GBAus27B_000138 [Mycoplasmataceae bacterium]
MLFNILLTKYLKGKKWNNIPNIVPGCQELTLTALKQIQQGQYVQGLTGKNNVLLIDESWNFFSKSELNKANYATHALSDLMLFLSETSKTDFKIFYVTKQGSKLASGFQILSANRSASIKTLGIKKFCYWWGKQYYYLELEVVGLASQAGFFNKINNWLAKSNQSTIISIPFSERDLTLCDNTWNKSKDYAMTRLKSILGEMDPDKLVRMLGYRKSRSQLLQENAEVMAWAKKTKNPDISGFQESDMIRKYWDLQKEKGWKPAEKKNKKSAKEKTAESQTVNTISEPATEGVEMTTIYAKVDQQHPRQSKKWQQAVEQEISLACEANQAEEETEEEGE